jgi:hypothetical protein
VPATRKRCTKHAPSPKSECGHLNGGKLKAVTYAFSPGYRENAEEEEEAVEEVFVALVIDCDSTCSRQHCHNHHFIIIVNTSTCS